MFWIVLMENETLAGGSHNNMDLLTLIIGLAVGFVIGRLYPSFIKYKKFLDEEKRKNGA